jgi:hypothetical protein
MGIFKKYNINFVCVYLRKEIKNLRRKCRQKPYNTSGKITVLQVADKIIYLLAKSADKERFYECEESLVARRAIAGCAGGGLYCVPRNEACR